MLFGPPPKAELTVERAEVGHQVTLLPQVHPELGRVAAPDTGQVVGELVGIDNLRDFPLVVVANREATFEANPRHALMRRPDADNNPQPGVVRIGEA